MAGSKSNYLENKVLDHVLGGSDYTRPATVYASLHTISTGEAGAGTECSGGSYARVAITNNNTNFPAASGGSKSNGTAISFPVLSGSIGTVVAWGIWDASTSGNLLYWGDLDVADQKAYVANDQPIIPASALTITED